MLKCQNTADFKSVRTYNLDIVGHPSQTHPLLEHGLPKVPLEQDVAFEGGGDLGQAAEEECGQGGRHEGQILAKQLLQV